MHCSDRIDVETIEQLQADDHPCLIFEEHAEQIAVVVPFITAGLERGERCLYICPDDGAGAVAEDLTAAGIDTADVLARGALIISPYSDVYNSLETFDPDFFLQILACAVKDSHRSGFTGLRLINDMSWAMTAVSDTQQLMEYELKLAKFLHIHQLPLLCLYNLTRFSSEIIIEVIHTHRKVIFGGKICRNHSYLSPEDFSRPDRSKVELDHLLQGMLANEVMFDYLQVQKSLLKTVVENTVDVIFVKDVNSRFLMINPAGAAFFGRAVEDVVGRSVGELLPPKSAAEIIAVDQNAMTCNQPITIEKTLTAADTTCTFLSTTTAYRDAKGNVIGVFGIARDITQRKEMESALRKSEEQFRTLCNSAPIGIFMTDADGNNIYSNPRWEQISGLSADESLGQGWIGSVHPDDRERLRQEALETRAAGQPYVYEYRILPSPEKTVWARILGSPLTDQEEKVTGFVGTVEDITELRNAGEEMLRTQKLESLGILAGGIAHDFNNILTAILGNISLARYNLDDPVETANRLADAEKAAARARDLTQQLLTFARGGAPVKKIIHTGSLIKEAANFAIHGSTVRCTFMLSEDLWPVVADEGQLSQVIHNLVINAVQAMPDGGTVTMWAENVDSPIEKQRSIKISVTDTGVGIAEQHLQNIFDPYFTTKCKGSGLGLATCYSIINKHGGIISVDSTPGKGSTFHLTLPAVELESMPANLGSPLKVNRGCGRVLQMDDEEPVREIAKAMLEELGYIVECTVDGAEAVELFRKRKAEGIPFSVVIMDLTVPVGMGGKEAIKSILAIDPYVKAVVSSGYSTDPVMADYRKYGFDAVLTKPFRMEELSEVLHQLL